jgi:moderate conductance mechanosensitive channel
MPPAGGVSFVTAPETEVDAQPSSEEIFGGDVDRPITEWLVENEITDSELVIWAVNNALEPALQILLILTLALLLLWLLRRTIRRAVERTKGSNGSTRRGVRRRIGLQDEGRPTYSARRAQRADALGALAKSVLGVVVWVIATFMILGTFGISLGPLVAGAGIIGLALGFGAQGLVSDFISGVFMLVEDQYGVGDIVDAGEAVGVVEGVTLRSTRIRDIEGTLWHIPNGEIRRIGNMSQKWARVLLDVQVAYETDVDAAMEIIEAVAQAMSEEEDYRDLFLDPPEVWGVQDLGADGIDLRLVIKTRPAEQWAIGRELRRRIKRAFDEAKVEIPFPQRTLWLRSEKPVRFAQARAESDGEGELPPDTAAMQRVLASAAQGDRGREALARQDMPDVEETVEEQVGETDGDATERP